MKQAISKLIKGAVLLCLCNTASAAILDFTDNSVGYTGTVDGVGYTLTNTGGFINRDEQPGTGCGILACDNDGVGITGGNDNDEVDSDQSLTLNFASPVYLTELHFLDLFENEQVKIVVDGGVPFYVDAPATPGVGGYFNYILASSMLASKIEFFAERLTGDNGDNNFALAGVGVSAVPLPPAVWLFGSAIIGLIGFRRKSA
jgi:hypothetical protein